MTAKHNECKHFHSTCLLVQEKKIRPHKGNKRTLKHCCLIFRYPTRKQKLRLEGGQSKKRTSKRQPKSLYTYIQYIWTQYIGRWRVSCDFYAQIPAREILKQLQMCQLAEGQVKTEQHRGKSQVNSLCVCELTETTTTEYGWWWSKQ